VLTSVTGMIVIGIPYEISSTWIGGLYGTRRQVRAQQRDRLGRLGAEFEIRVSGRPGTRRFLLDANITCIGSGKFVLGKSQRVLLSANSSRSGSPCSCRRYRSRSSLKNLHRHRERLFVRCHELVIRTSFWAKPVKIPREKAIAIASRFITTNPTSG